MGGGAVRYAHREGMRTGRRGAEEWCADAVWRAAMSAGRGEIAARAGHTAYGSDIWGRTVALFELCSIH